MVGKSFIGTILAIFIVLSFLPVNIGVTATRGWVYTLETNNLPQRDPNGNFTVRNYDEWHIIGEKAYLVGNITLEDNTKLIIKDSNITISGTLWAKDYSSVLIESSIVWFEIPPSDPVLVDKQYDGPYGFVMTDEETSITIERSSVYLHRADFFWESVPNYTKPGEVMVVFGKCSFIDSYLNTNGTEDGLPYPPRGFVVHMDCEFKIINSILTSGVKAYVNAHGIIESTNFKSLSLEKNTAYSEIIVSNSTITTTATIDMASTVLLKNCEIEKGMIVKNRGVAKLQNTTIYTLKMFGNGTLIMDQSDFPVELPESYELNHIFENSNLTLLNDSYMQKVYAFGNSTISSINSSINSTQLYDGTFVRLKDSSIDNLSAEDNSTIWLQNSDIGTYYIYDNASIYNVTNLVVSIKLNQQPHQGPIKLKDSTGNILFSSETDEKGTADITLKRNMISINQTSMEIMYLSLVTYCIVEADFENLHDEVGMDIDEAFMEVELSFDDYTAPIIDKVHFETDPFIRTQEKVLVSAHVEDEDTNIANVVLKYSTDDGKTWKNLTLYNIGQDIYENSIPSQGEGTKVIFYIVAEDNCGNIEESPHYSYIVGEGVVHINNLIIISAFIVLLGIIIVFTAKVVLNKIRIKKYLRSAEK
ncbi:MAG: hypothetical protein JSW00_09275 [Thermoplasmata archaeon]|nr:MAG: hypothetical protein JSW00_09275 [Thermoplasmata archaeon]